ncbi:MAG: alpha/beta fold hydrolase [Deltaproteobacteria bacterium]|nr:alpha/beta fold hydrolase [Deltaproteobacteria bacterium]
MQKRLLICLLLVLFAASCGTSHDADDGTVQVFPDNPRTEFGGERPVTLQVPTTYDSSKPLPLVIILHGYSANGFIQQAYLRLSNLAETQTVLVIAPDGTFDSSGNRFWNATDVCCNDPSHSVDDVAYIRGLITDIRHDYNVDAKRIYLIGHSNGGFMAHRLACDAASEVAAIVSLAGATYTDASKCKPSQPVSILDIHGDRDDTIAYDGGGFRGSMYPSEQVTMEHWQVYDRCQPGLALDSMRLDLELTIIGPETDVQRFNGCARATGVELWSIRGGGHIPTLTRYFPTLVWQWLKDHPKQ